MDNQILQLLIDVCERKIKDFSLNIDGLDLKFKQNKKQAVWEITGYLSKFEIVYLKKESLLRAPSTLYARIYPQKNNALFFLPHEMLIIDNPTAITGASVFSFIESEQRMEKCIALLLKTLKSTMRISQEWALDENKWQMAENAKTQEIYRILKLDKNKTLNNEKLYIDYEQWVLLPRFAGTQGPYINLALSRIKKAKKQYLSFEKKNVLTAYEKKILYLLKQGESDFIAFLFEGDGTVDALPIALEEGKQLLFGMIICYIPFAVIFCLFTYLLGLFLSRDTLFFSGVDWYFGVVTAGLPAVFGGLAFYRKIIQILYPENKLIALNLANIKISKTFSKINYIIFTVVFIGCVVMTMLISLDNVAFYDDRLSYNDTGNNYFSVSLKEKPYSQIDGIYKIESRYNDFGDKINRSSYVLYFKDGETLDLDGYDSLKNTEKYILPILSPYSGMPVTLESDRDLPKK